jgi:small subunit ribosomal protein S2
MAIVSMKELLEAGVHFGHRRRRWHPKMRSYIFTERNGIHIIDLQQTIRLLGKAHNFIRDTAAEGGTVLFVCTKKQGAENIQIQAERGAMPYVNQRWLGGTLTNFSTIRQRANYLLELEKKKELGEFALLPKKEASWKEKELAKLQRLFGGISNMYYLPSALFVADTRREEIAVREANMLGIPVVAMVDSNCDPDLVDWIIPANDDAIRAIKLMATKIADAVVEGQQMRGVIMAEEREAEALGGPVELPGEGMAADIGEPQVEQPAMAVEEAEAAEGQPVEEPAADQPPLDEQVLAEEPVAEGLEAPKITAAENEVATPPEDE